MDGESSTTNDRASRHPGAWLLARVFAVDVTVGASVVRPGIVAVDVAVAAWVGCEA
jgi:hypothetical protein